MNEPENQTGSASKATDEQLAQLVAKYDEQTGNLAKTQIDGALRLISLSAGALVLIATLLNKKPEIPGAGLPILAALVCFLVSFFRSFQDATTLQTIVGKIAAVRLKQEQVLLAGKLGTRESWKDLFDEMVKQLRSLKAAIDEREVARKAFFGGVLAASMLAVLNILKWLWVDMCKLLSFIR